MEWDELEKCGDAIIYDPRLVIVINESVNKLVVARS